jgi:hypothetical protein
LRPFTAGASVIPAQAGSRCGCLIVTLRGVGGNGSLPAWNGGQGEDY